MTIGQKIPQTPTVYTPKELALRKEIRSFEKCYIFVNTNFKRKDEPIFALAFMEHVRRLAIPKEEFAFKNDEEIFASVSQIVQKHYEENKGKLPLWGKIDNYYYHHKDEKVYTFDNNGMVIENDDINESRATISIR